MLLLLLLGSGREASKGSDGGRVFIKVLKVLKLYLIPKEGFKLATLFFSPSAPLNYGAHH